MRENSGPKHDNTARLPRLSVVIPCFDEEGGIRALHERVTKVCRETVDQDYELILVNDGSRDRTWTIIKELIAHDPKLVAVGLSRNYGQQSALSAGLHVSRGERVLILDADLQDPPELLPKMMERMDAGCDVVYGMRTKRLGEPNLKKLASSAFYRFLGALAEIDIPLDAGDFRLLSRRVVDALESMPESHRFIRGMVSWIGFRQEAVPYERAARTAGETKYSVSKLLRLALDAITGFSVRPLRLASYMGYASAIGAVFLLIYILASWASGAAVPGWTSLMLVVVVMGSCQLLVLGVIGEYLGRLYVESKRRPLFIIQDVLRGENPSAGVSARLPGTAAAERGQAV